MDEIILAIVFMPSGIGISCPSTAQSNAYYSIMIGCKIRENSVTWSTYSEMRHMLLYEEISCYGISNSIVALAGYDTIKHHL